MGNVIAVWRVEDRPVVSRREPQRRRPAGCTALGGRYPVACEVPRAAVSGAWRFAARFRSPCAITPKDYVIAMVELTILPA